MSTITTLPSAGITGLDMTDRLVKWALSSCAEWLTITWLNCKWQIWKHSGKSFLFYLIMSQAENSILGDCQSQMGLLKSCVVPFVFTCLHWHASDEVHCVDHLLKNLVCPIHLTGKHVQRISTAALLFIYFVLLPCLMSSSAFFFWAR